MPEDDELNRSNGLGRILALSDGVFAIAMTLLVFNLSIRTGLPSPLLSKALRHLDPRFFSAALSFVFIGLLWMGHHRMYSYIVRIDRVLLELNLLSLAPVVFMPFATVLLSEYGSQSEGAAVYASTVAVASLLYLLQWWYATYHRRLTSGTLSRQTILWCAARPFTTAVIFIASIPVAVVSPSSARYMWLALFVPLVLVGNSHENV